MEKAISLLNEKVIPLRKEINERCINYLKKTLEEAENKRISFLNENGEYINDTPLCVSYDGGNHPEYASNVFNNVQAIYLDEKNNIKLDTDECNDYGIERITWDELFDIANYVFEVVIPHLKKD